MSYVYDDGGRAAAGYKGETGDCVVRAVAIATQQDYQTVYDTLSEGCRAQRRSRRTGLKKSSAAEGVNVNRKWFRDYMAALGWVWTPTMGIGTGCRVHLRAHELPRGRIIVSLSKHWAAVIDGITHDVYDPDRDGSRCVYGYWKEKEKR